MLSYLVPRNRKLTFLFLCLNLGEKYQEASHKMGGKKNVGLKYRHKTRDLGQIIPFTYQCVLKN